jgi:hypothetical protein
MCQVGLCQDGQVGVTVGDTGRCMDNPIGGSGCDGGISSLALCVAPCPDGQLGATLEDSGRCINNPCANANDCLQTCPDGQTGIDGVCKSPPCSSSECINEIRSMVITCVDGICLTSINGGDPSNDPPQCASYGTWTVNGDRGANAYYVSAQARRALGTAR